VPDGFSWVLLVLQHCAHSRNRATATNEKKKSLLYFGCDFSAVGKISGKSLKRLPPDVTATHDAKKTIF